MENPLTCSDVANPFLHYFDISIAPHLLFYSYIPTIVISLLLGLFVLFKSKNFLGELLFLITLFFSLWVVDILILWIAIYNDWIMLGWQLTPLFEVPIFIFSVYFIYAFTDRVRVDAPNYAKIIFLLVGLITVVLLPTRHNISMYDLAVCEGVLGHLWDFMYTFEIVSVAWIIGICLRRYRSLEKSDPFRRQVVLMGTGIALFLVLFIASNIIGEVTGQQTISFIGALGMTFFLSFVAYMMVSFRIFNVGLVGAQVLVISLVVLIGSQLFFVRNEINKVLTSITLVLTGVLGLVLVRNVKKEIAQREQIEAQEKELKKANGRLKELDQMKTEFVSLATHQIRAPLASIKGYVSMIQEGDFGKISPEAKKALEIVFDSTNNLVAIVADFLDVSRIEQGRMKYDYSDFDINKLVEETVAEYKPNIMKRGLKVSYVSEQGKNYTIHADQGKIKQVIGNVIDNSIKYTPEGSISIALTQKDGKNLIKIADTGVGIRAETLPKLFKKFSRAEDAVETNIMGTGLGLYVAKTMVESMSGRIWAESEGTGKGAQFYIELPAAKIQ